jgi:hypothetical protein
MEKRRHADGLGSSPDRWEEISPVDFEERLNDRG